MPGGSRTGLPGFLQNPTAIAIDRDNRIYVADMYNGRVVIFQYLQGKGRGAPDAASGTSSGTAVKTGAGIAPEPAQQQAPK